MPAPLMIPAAQAAQAAGSAGATALGLGMGKTDLDLTRDLFKMQMRQAKRLWTADWAEASMRHGESCLQSAQQHSESQAMASAAYFQAQKIASQGFKLARDQDSRAYEMSWRAELRESLRDELVNQNSRFNIVMLCDTVCLGCVFSLVADGTPPTETPDLMRNVYVFFMGLSITLFTISLWCSVIVVRRLHEHTASILERKLFAQSEDLQEAWQHQLAKNLPTGPHIMHMMNQAYEKWVADYIDPVGKRSIHMMSFGVVAMFISAGIFVHSTYIVEYNAPTSVAVFWFTVLVTSLTVLYMKYAEDAIEKRKEGVYDNSWQDRNTVDMGPFAKINRTAGELYSETAVGLGSVELMNSLGNLEQMERDYCAKTKSLHNRVESFRQESRKRAKTRKDVVQLLTTAAEERDALPEELTSILNKVLHDIDEADSRTAMLLSMQYELAKEGSRKDWTRLRSPPRMAMASDPIDAQRIPVALGAVRKKLGDIPRTTLLRLRNLSNEPLRLKSGAQLQEGNYIETLKTIDPNGNSVSYQLYPVTEIPPRTEVVIAARSGGRWIPTSGIEGEIVYTNRDESWFLRINFCNELVKNYRSCQVQASRADKSEHGTEDEFVDQYWQISRDVLDRKANNEVVVSMDVRLGEEAQKAELDHRQSRVSLKKGFLHKQSPYGLRLRWQQRWFVLTPTEINYSQDAGSKKTNTIAIKDITSVQLGKDIVHKNVFEIHVSNGAREPYKLAASSPAERIDWIQKIQSATGTNVAELEPAELTRDDSSFEDEQDIIECILSDTGTEVLSV